MHALAAVARREKRNVWMVNSACWSRVFLAAQRVLFDALDALFPQLVTKTKFRYILVRGFTSVALSVPVGGSVLKLSA